MPSEDKTQNKQQEGTAIEKLGEIQCDAINVDAWLKTRIEMQHSVDLVALEITRKRQQFIATHIGKIVEFLVGIRSISQLAS